MSRFRRKTFPTFIILLLAYLPVTSAKPKIDIISSDQEIFEKIVGTWTPSPMDMYAVPGLDIYSADGSLTSMRYKTSECVELAATTKATWSVTNGKLVIIVRDSNEFPVGLVSIDDILSIKNNVMKLQSGKHKPVQIRIKQDTCIKNK